MADARRAARVLLVSAPASGQGKTTVSAALARKLCRDGRTVRVFKTGPDFLDPMMLARAAGAPVGTLDLWMVGADDCRRLLAQAAQEADVILVEGVMGLYDGTPSSADLARAFGLPVLAVIDASAMAQTAGALVAGLRDYGPVSLAGVVANRVAGEAHAAMVAGALRGVPLLGFLPAQESSLPERHLGLLPPHEVAAIDALLDDLADRLSLDAQALAGLPAIDLPAPEPATLPPLLAGRTIALAWDDAFVFAYPASISCLEAMGARVVAFSPLRDDAVPAGADAVYLPGGYPELHAETLARARRWQASMRDAHARGLPIYAECGGMMALAETLVDARGTAHAMAGLLSGRTVMQKRLAALGPQEWRTPAGALRGHAFHFSRFESPLAPCARALRHGGKDNDNTGEPVYRAGSLTASYFHAYFPSCPEAAAALFLPCAAA